MKKTKKAKETKRKIIFDFYNRHYLQRQSRNSAIRRRRSREVFLDFIFTFRHHLISEFAPGEGVDAGGDTAVEVTSNEKDPALIFRVGEQRDRQPGERSRLSNLTSFS